MTAPLPLDPDVEAQLFCPFCGYDMRASFGTGCPECGERFDEEAMRRAQVPWANRREIGRVRATWQTFWRVTFQSKRFGRAVSQPVDLREALRFRRRVVWVLWLTFVLPAAALVLLEVIPLLDGYWFEQIAAGWKWAAALMVGVLLWVWLYACTGVHSYWFHPRRLPTERQNRAVALSCYACAPLLLLPVAVVFGTMGAVVWSAAHGSGVPAGELLVIAGIIALLTLGVLPLLLSFLGFWWATSSLAGRSADRGVLGRFTLMVGQPLACALLLGLLGVVLPGAFGYLWLMLTTMT